MNLKAKFSYSVVWYAIFGVIIFFVHIMMIDILMLILGALVCYVSFRQAFALKQAEEEYKLQLYLGVFQLILLGIIGLVFYYSM